MDNTKDFVHLEVSEGVGTIHLDRPPLNIFNVAMQAQLHDVAIQAATDQAVRAVVVFGGTRTFSAGVDVREMADMTHADMLRRVAPMQAAINAIAAIPKPVVAAIRGFAIGGGCELALAADLRFCADDAKLGQPEILLGVIPGAGGTQRLTRLVGPANAKDLVFTGRLVDAQEALRMGLVDRVTSPEALHAAALEWAAQFAHGPAQALQAAKEAIDGAADHDLESGLALERRAFAALFDTEDRTIGMRSFIECGAGKARFVGR